MPLTARYAWLLDAEIGGQHLRYAVDEEAVEVAGATETYRSGLVADLEITASESEVSIELSDRTLDAPRIGPRLEGAACTLRRWRVGTPIESAEVYARGTATAAEWGSRDEPLRWTIRALEDLPPMPEPECMVSASTTKPDPNDPSTYEIPGEQEGLYYPTVFGVPGQRIFFISGVPVNYPEFVIPCPMRVLFTSTIPNPNSEIVISSDAAIFVPSRIAMREDRSEMETFPPSSSFPNRGLLCKTSTDALGRSITVATLSDPRVRPLTNDGPIYLASAREGDGGIPAPREAYDVILYALERWGGTTVDRARLPEIRDHLRGYLVDTWVNEPVDGGVWGWLVEALGVGDLGSSEASGLPVAIRQGAGGRYLAPLRYQIDPRRTTRTLDAAGGDVVRQTRIRADDEPANEIVTTYAGDRAYPAWIGGASTGTLISADAAFQTITDTDTLAKQSIARYGRRQVEVEVPWTWDPGTAARVGLDVLARLALPWRRVSYRVPEAWGVREGEQVRIVDAEVALDELAIVDSPPLVGGSDGVLLALRLPGVP